MSLRHLKHKVFKHEMLTSGSKAGALLFPHHRVCEQILSCDLPCAQGARSAGSWRLCAHLHLTVQLRLVRWALLGSSGKTFALLVQSQDSHPSLSNPKPVMSIVPPHCLPLPPYYLFHAMSFLCVKHFVFPSKYTISFWHVFKVTVIKRIKL
jgi:hypothetical protein